MSDNDHISKTDFYAFQNDFMTRKEKEDFLEHICSCNYCSDQFSALMSEDIITAPRDLKENILKATKRLDVQLAVKVKETSKRMQLLIYSLKVGTATIFALAILIFTMNFTDIMNVPKVPDRNTEDTIVNEDPTTSFTTKIRDNMNKISNSMLDFSNNIMKTEVTDYDQEEK